MVQKHKRPSEQITSTFFVSALKKFHQSANLVPALDLPCGFGRHSLYLSQKFDTVVCADYDRDVFYDRWFDGNQSLAPIILNANKNLPFKSESFGLVAIIHFYSNELFANIRYILKPGGIVIFESFGGQGENWRELPAKDNFKESLDGAFEILYFKEKVVGPEKSNITVKMVARKNE